MGFSRRVGSWNGLRSSRQGRHQKEGQYEFHSWPKGGPRQVCLAVE